MNMKNSTWWVIIVILLIIIIGLAWFLFATPRSSTGVNATSTATSTGELTGTVVGGADATSTGVLHDRVVVDAPKSGQTVFQSFTVTGKAPGQWYFEASFPIRVVDAKGNIVATGHANALSDWMTTADVPFKADIKLTVDYSGPATLILMKDNPSGLPQNEDSVSIPIVIKNQ